MKCIRVPRPRHIPTLGVSMLLAATLATTACGQSQGAAASGAAANPDSIVNRANRERMKGPEDAPLTIIELSDFQCPYCREFATTTYRQIDSAYVRTGRARIIYVNLPLSTHKEAFPAAEAAMCAGAQGRFWQMHDRLFATQREWSGQPDAVARFERLAQEVGVDVAAYRDCTANDRTATLIVADAMQAAEARINGTPTFILNSRNGQRALTGAVPFDQFSREIDALLAGPPAPAPGQTPPPTAPPAQP